MTDKTLNIQSIPHSFSVERVDHTLPLGLSIAEIIATVQPDDILRPYVHAFINGDYIPQENWAAVRPKQQAIVSLRMVPQGGGGKNPLRTILSVALLAATPQLGALIGSGLSAQFGGAFSLSLTSKLVTGGLNFVARLALNALAPPSRSGFSRAPRETQTQYIQGSRNRIEPFGNIPQVLGRPRMVPPLAAKPYTETIGNDQYVRMLFVWGFGPLDITDLKIGETAIEEFEDIEIENRSGTEGEAPISLYTSVVDQNDLQVKLTKAAGYEVRTTDSDVDEISVDITFPKGLTKFENNGSRSKRQVQVEIQYAPTGTNEWTAGVYNFKAIAAQTVNHIEPPGHFGFTSSMAGYDYRFYKRIDLVVLDIASGQASIIYGQKNHGFDAMGEQHLGLSVRAPQCPQNKIEIARIISLGDTVGAEVIDKRSFEDVGDIYQSASDFVVNIVGDDIQIAAGGLKFSGFDVTSKQSVSLRKSVRFKVPRGQYDVRLRRLTDDSNDDEIFDEVYWTALRSIRHEDPLPLSGLAVTALRVRATDQLNGTIDQFNGIVTARIPDWDGENWNVRATSNPASIYRHVLQGAANARPLTDDRIDISKLQEWHGRCAENEREFNAVISGGKSVMDVISDVAAAGRASPTIIDGRWGVVEDVAQSAPVQHFTPRNSWGFEAERAFEDRPHALRIKFNNRDKGFQLDERLVFDDGYDENNATKFETLELAGITDTDHIWRDGRYHIASARLRPEVYSFHTDIEHIVCTRGDRVQLTHDAALIGLQSARIKSVETDGINVTEVMLDCEITMESGKSYVLRIRTQSNVSVVVPLVNAESSTNSVEFETPHSGAPIINAGDLCVFGEAGRDSLDLIVKSIEPQDDLNAKITCVDAAPDLHLADQDEIPTYNSGLTIPPELVTPTAPVIKAIQSGAEAIKRNTDGSFAPRIFLTFEPPSDISSLNLSVRIKSKDESGYYTPRIQKTGTHSYIIEDVEEGEFYDIALKYVRNNNIASEVTQVSNYEVIGLRDKPADVENFAIAHVGDTAHLSWSTVSDIDLSYYQVRFTSDLINTPSWNAATDLVPKISKTATSVSVPAMDGYYLIKAVDLGGRHSENETVIKSDIASVLNLNVVETLTEHSFFNGDKSGVVTVNNSLRLDAVDRFDDWSDLDDINNIDIGESGFLTNGIYYFDNNIDLGASYTSHITANIRLSGLDLNDVLDDQGNIDVIESWDNTALPDNWSIIPQIRTTDDDPAAAPEWGAWQNFVIGNYTARAFEFRVILSSDVNGVTPVINALSITVDMPDRIISDQDVVSASGGSMIDFTHPFRAKPAVAISAQDMQAGDYFAVSSVSNSGFTIQFFDQSNTPISRSFDYLAKGYGQRL